MDTPTQTLELVSDDFPPGSHEYQDRMVHGLYETMDPSFDPSAIDIDVTISGRLLAVITRVSRNRLLSKYKDSHECEGLIRSKPNIMMMMKRGWSEGFREVRLLRDLRPPSEKTNQQEKEDMDGSEYTLDGIQQAWERDYIGDADHTLWSRIQEMCQPSGQLHANYATVFQSSGMGKSRVVDELSKAHFVIPVNLRSSKSTGYPPPDESVVDYLSSAHSRNEAFLRSCSFLHALFAETAVVLEEMETNNIVQKFRSYMTDRMTRDQNSRNRVEFYKTVVTRARNEWHKVYSRYLRLSDDMPLSFAEDRLAKNGSPLRVAFNAMKDVLEKKLNTSSSGPPPEKRQKPNSESPLVILAFDEVHNLADNVSTDSHGTWSRFGEIRRAIEGLFGQPVFTLFLSTSGSLYSTTPTTNTCSDTSGRMTRRGAVMLPFCELDFDQYAMKLNFVSGERLSEVTSDARIASYGRPLWLPYYDSSPDDFIVFAACKLLGGVLDSRPLDDNQKFACLARRIPIEFLSSTYGFQVQSEQEMEQVKSHMRVVLRAEENLETVVTASSSEPVLSEAAYFVMQTSSHKSFSPPKVLQTTLNKFSVEKGEVGELIVALLFILARDNAVGPPRRDDGRPISEHRWCTVTDLFRSLFSDATPVLNSTGWRFTSEKTEPIECSLETTFQDSKVYFNHFIKPHEQSIQVDYLMHLMARGAALLCPQSQFGVDGIIPFLLRGDEIRSDNIGVIMFKCLTDNRFTGEPQRDLFYDMDPRRHNVIDPFANIPVIRFIFALPADPPSLEPVKHTVSDRRCNFNSYSAYDFWVAGLSSQVFTEVAKDEDVWGAILRASQPWSNIFSGDEGKVRRRMCPGTGYGEDFWKNWSETAPGSK